MVPLLIPLDHTGVPWDQHQTEKQACVSRAPDTSWPSLIVLILAPNTHHHIQIQLSEMRRPGAQATLTPGHFVALH